MRAAGESEPFSPKNPALSPGEGMAGAAREACGAGTPTKLRGKVNRFRGKTRHFPQGWKWQVRPERPEISWTDVCPAIQAAGESEPFSRKSPALSPGVEMAGAARGVCGAGAPAGRGGK